MLIDSERRRRSEGKSKAINLCSLNMKTKERRKEEIWKMEAEARMAAATG